MGPTEYRLLEFFMEKPTRVFSRDQLLDNVRGRDAYIDERTVDVQIGRLRKTLTRGKEKKLIRTIRGAGYARDPLKYRLTLFLREINRNTGLMQQSNYVVRTPLFSMHSLSPASGLKIVRSSGMRLASEPRRAISRTMAMIGI